MEIITIYLVIAGVKHEALAIVHGRSIWDGSITARERITEWKPVVIGGNK